MNAENEIKLGKRVAKKLMFTLYVVILLMLAMSNLKAQNIKYQGLEAGLGARPIRVSSNISAIDGLQVVKSGGHVGYFFGNDAYIIPIKLGFYFTAIGDEPRTFGILELSTRINYSLTYLIAKKSTRLNVYGIAGMSLQNQSFIGTYITKENRLHKPVRDKFSMEPVIGHQLNLNAQVGLGIQWQIRADFDYIALFAEAFQQFNLGYQHDNPVLNNSHIQNLTSFNIGFRVGK